MAELVDALDLGSSAARRGGSTPFTRTKKTSFKKGVFLYLTISVFFTNHRNKCIFAIHLKIENENYTKQGKKNDFYINCRGF